MNFDLSLNQFKSIKWSSNIAISHRATHVVVEDLSKPQPLESLELHIQPGEISTPDEVSKTLIDNDTVFNAETLLQYRKRNGQNQYLVKWVGYPESEVTWEPESNILDARLIENFEATHSTP